MAINKNSQQYKDAINRIHKQYPPAAWPAVISTLDDTLEQRMKTDPKGSDPYEVRSAGSIEGPPDPVTAAVDRLIENAKQTKAENTKTINDWLAGAKPQLSEAGTAANASEQGIISDLGTAGGTANTAETDAINALIAGNPEAVKAHELGAPISSVAAGATASPESIAYQNQALQKLSGLTDPTVTAKEKFLEMQARQQEEQSRKSAMDAMQADLARRGVRSGGAEIAGLTGAQQTTSQNRMMQDLGTNAGAVDRAMAAIQGLGTLSSTQRGQSFHEKFSTGSAADDINKFNSSQKADYQKWKDEFNKNQNTDIFGRQKDIASARTTGAADIYGRGKDVLGARAGAVKDAYGRTQDEINLGQTATGMKVGATTSGGQQTGQALQTGVGLSAEEQAIESLKHQGGLFGHGGFLGTGL